MESEKGTHAVETASAAPAVRETSTILKVVGALFALMGLGHFMLGIPFIIFLGLGFVFMAFGALEIYLGVLIYNGKKKGYIPALVVGILSGFSSFSLYRGSALIPLIFLAIIYLHRDEFVN